jgi:hypothetical protein
MWLGLLARFWKPLLGALVVLAILYAAYSHGRKVERSDWEPRFAAAERAKVEADARAEAKEELARRLSRESDERYAHTIARLNERAADAQRDIDGILRKLTAAIRREVPADGGAPAGTDAAPAGGEYLGRTAGDLAELARKCESDSAQLAELQRFVAGQLAALN